MVQKWGEGGEKAKAFSLVIDSYFLRLSVFQPLQLVKTEVYIYAAAFLKTLSSKLI